MGYQKRNIISGLTKLFKFREAGILVVLISIFAAISIMNSAFAQIDNIIVVLRSTSFVFIAAVAMTFLIMAGELDLSISYVMALGAIISGLVAVAGLPLIIVIIVCILTGGCIGLLNAMFTLKFRIPSLIVTIGMGYIVKSLVFIITKGVPVYPLPDSYNELGQGYFLGIPYVILFAIALGICGFIVLKYTKYGRYICAVGGNRETARLSGINISLIKTIAFIMTSAFAAFSGMLMAGRLGSGQTGIGTGYEMLTISAVIIGGTSMFGGSGTMLGSAIGALLMNVIQSGMVALKVSIYYQNMVIGAIIIFAVAIDQYRRQKRGVIQ